MGNSDEARTSGGVGALTSHSNPLYSYSPPAPVVERIGNYNYESQQEQEHQSTRAEFEPDDLNPVPADPSTSNVATLPHQASQSQSNVAIAKRDEQSQPIETVTEVNTVEVLITNQHEQEEEEAVTNRNGTIDTKLVCPFKRENMLHFSLELSKTQSFSSCLCFEF